MKECFFKVCRIICKLVFYIIILAMIIFFFNPSLIGKCIVEDKFISRLETILPALIAVAGVYATVANNRRGTYKEIVTRERIEWLHKMQENLANYLEPSSSIEAISDPNIESDNSVKYNADVNRLYYNLIFNINHNNDADALNALNNYHNARYGKPGKLKVNLALKDEVKLELVLDKGEEDELLFLIKNKSELDKLKDLILSDEFEKIKIGNVNENFDEEEETEKELFLLKEEVAEEFTEIFNETWNKIKNEAD